MDPESLLIKKILLTGNIKKPIRENIVPEKFVNKEAGTWYKWLIDYYHDNAHPGAVPDEETFRYHFSRALLPDEASPDMAEIIRMVKVKQLKAIFMQIGDTLYRAGSELDDIDDILDVGQRCNIELLDAAFHSSKGRISHLSADIKLLLEEYEYRKTGKLSGVMWPWPRVNEKTNGLEPGTLTMIYGRPKQMKTWIGLYVASMFYMISTTSKVLVYSCEMSEDQIRRRTSAIIARVDYHKFIKGRLSPDEEVRFQEALNELITAEQDLRLNGHKKDYIIIRPSEPSVMDLRANIENINPDLVFIDSVQYMALGDVENKVDYKMQTRLSQDLKRTALSYQIPILITHQANRTKAETTENVALSDSWARDSDAVIEVTKIDDGRVGKVLALLFRAAREYDLTGIYIHGKPAYNFDFIDEIPSMVAYEEYLKENRKRLKEAEKSRLKVRDEYY